MIASQSLFRNHFNIDVRVLCEAVSISRGDMTVQLRNVVTGELSTQSYDKLVLAPGAATIHPPIPGIDLPGIFEVRTVPGAHQIRAVEELHNDQRRAQARRFLRPS